MILLYMYHRILLVLFSFSSKVFMLNRILSKLRSVNMITSTKLNFQDLSNLTSSPPANILLEFSAFSCSLFVKCGQCPREYLSRKAGMLVLWAHLDIQNLILQSSLYTEQCAKCQGSNIHFYPDYNPFFLKTEAYVYAYAWSTWKFGTEALRPWTGLCSYLFCLTHYWILRSNECFLSAIRPEMGYW